MNKRQAKQEALKIAIYMLSDSTVNLTGVLEDSNDEKKVRKELHAIRQSLKNRLDNLK